MQKRSSSGIKAAGFLLFAVLLSGVCFAQPEASGAMSGVVVSPIPSSLSLLPDLPSAHPPQEPQPARIQHGFVVRNLMQRGLRDQKELYAAPFKGKNLKWDALFLGTTAALLATDRQVMRDVPRDHVNVSHDIALTLLLGTGAAAGGTWLYGLKTGDRHADETGELTLESLANTFLIYTPMQFIAGRERPDDGTGNGTLPVPGAPPQTPVVASVSVYMLVARHVSM